ncbi:MAG: alpha/beta hydrolase [Pleurocapsa sp. MO_192.B19]|nr:alpha/beta hydrolase [Pleurocapsa sp. MO_192.B19]
MPTIDVRGVSHYYEWIRHPQNQSYKPVMVFLHGWGGSARYWRSTAEALANDFDCLLYDMRGFGRSALLQDSVNWGYDMEDYAEDLAALLDALNLNQIYLNAHSMGASIATLFINRYRERVQQAILTCNGIFEYDAKAFAAFHRFGEYVVRFRYNWFLKVPFADRMFMARFLHRPISKSDRIAFLEDFLMADYNAAAGTIYTSVSKQAVEIMPQEFAKLTVPTLMVSGEKDIIIPAVMGKQAAALNNKIKYVELPQTSHFPMLEDETAYLSAVREFLQLGRAVV